MFGRKKIAIDDGQEQEVKRDATIPSKNIHETAELRDIKGYHETKQAIFAQLITVIDVARLAQLDTVRAKSEIQAAVREILARNSFVLSSLEQEQLIADVINDTLGFGPLEALLARTDIADIMVNGAHECFIEVGGLSQRVQLNFRDNDELLAICQRIVSRVGRRVDEMSPICDARLLDGSRVNVIVPPLALKGPTLTIRKFKKDKLTLSNLVEYRSLSEDASEILRIIGRCRCNIIVSGGTGSGKTTLLNCLTNTIDAHERIITCEDTVELQPHGDHVVQLETRPPSLEGQGEVTMRELVKNCLRMRPERIIIGEVRGPEMFDLLQAMNTGHDGSMGTIHANSPREALSRMESLIMMGGFGLSTRVIREMIQSSVDVIIQAVRMRDGSRRVTHITEVVGIEGDIITLQDIVRFNVTGETADGKLIGHHEVLVSGPPKITSRVSYFGETTNFFRVLGLKGSRR